MSEAGSAPVLRFASSVDDVRLLDPAVLPELVGATFTGDWFVLGRDRLEPFEHAIHVDELPFPFGGSFFEDDLIEGTQLLGLLDFLINPIFVIQGAGAYGVNYGYDRVRFVSPVRAGQRMRLTGVVAQVRPRDDGGFLVRHDCSLEVDGRERPGLTVEWWSLWYPSDPDADRERDTDDR